MKMFTQVLLPVVVGIIVYVVVTVAVVVMLDLSGTPPHRRGATPGLAGALAGLSCGLYVWRRTIREPAAEISSDTKPDSVQSLQREVDTLWKLGEEVASERDAWMQRALNAEEKIKVLQETSNIANQGSDSNFLAIKKAFVRLFHPDISKSTGYEKVIRTEVFKEFWPEIERIERQDYRSGVKFK